MTMQVVINATSKLVLRHGFCDFEHDGSYDSGTEEIIEKYWVFDPTICKQNWYWNSATEEFQQTAPE